MANFQQLRAAAKEHADKYNPDQGGQEQTEGGFTFAKIGPYISSEAEQAQLQRLAAIQQEANETVFDSRTMF
jgi:hypothetical protein